MKLLMPLIFFAAAVKAHYLLSNITYNNVSYDLFKYFRKPLNLEDPTRFIFNPLEDVTAIDLRCNRNPQHQSEILPVEAGSEIIFDVASAENVTSWSEWEYMWIFHPGPFVVYMAKVPEGKVITDWGADGPVWFKIHEQGPAEMPAGWLGPPWPTYGLHSLNLTIPASVPNGDYLIRAEHIAIHIQGAPQFYPTCAQITVTGGGNGIPGPMVEFPGAYSLEDPGLAASIDPYNYASSLTDYIIPGPPVWKG